MFVRRSIRFLRFGLATSLLFGVVGAAVAASSSGQGLEISPAITELTANPGDTVTANIQVRNVTNVTVVTNGTADDFGAKGEDGEPQLLLDEKESGPYSLKFWVAGVPDLRLAPREVKTATIKIKVPQNAEPGGHYGVIRFTAQPADVAQGASGVSLSASIGGLVFLRVNGNLQEKMSVADFYASQSGNKADFFETGPVSFIERLKNDGTLHEKPTGNIEIFNSWGQKVDSIAVNNPPRNVLPASTRKFQETWNKKWLFGRYDAKLNLSYGDNQKLAATTSFWIVPYKLILLILLVLVVLILALRYAIKRYNAWVIAQAFKRR